MAMQEVALFEAHDSYILCLQFTADSQTVISASMDNVVKTWSVPDWNHLSTIEAHANSVNGFALTPDETRLVTCSSDQTVKVWSFPDGDLLHTLQDRKKVVASIAMSDDGMQIAAASYGGRVMIWTLDGEDAVGIKASKKNITSAAFHPSGNMLACSGLGDDILLWSLPEGAGLGTLSGHNIAVGSLNFLGDGQTLMSWGYDQTVIFWDMDTRTAARTIKLEPQSSRGFLLSPDQSLAAVLMESRVDVRTVPDWTLLQSLPISTKSVSSAAFSRDGRWMAVGGADRKIRIFSRD